MSDDLEGLFSKPPRSARKPATGPQRSFALRVRGGPTLDGGPHIQFNQPPAESPPPMTGSAAHRNVADADSLGLGSDRNAAGERFPDATSHQPTTSSVAPWAAERATVRAVPPKGAERGKDVGPECQLVIAGLKKTFTKGPAEISVLRGVNLAVRRGEFLAIVGQSGSGKSTLLHLLATLDTPDDGEIYFDGHRIDNLAGRLRDRLRNERIGMIFQFYHLLPELTALENVLTPIMIRHGVLGYFARRGHYRHRAEKLLQLVGLEHRIQHRPREMSGGEMQRAAIARALIGEPELLLADEPTGNLDQMTGRDILEILCALNRRQNLTIVMVTHDPGIAQRADRVVRMVDGRLDAQLP
jgi:lipoprotein-releasing system ATP-binding protein